MYDIIVVGAGFSGATVAREMAEKHNRKVLVIDKRKQVAGNMFECFDSQGIRIHQYGPHIFHTNNEFIFRYLCKFSKFYKYEHKVVGKIEGKLVPIPFNFTSLEILFSEEEASEIKKELLLAYPKQTKVSILDLINNDSTIVKHFGEFVYENVFVHYTAKQWNQPIEDVDTSVINRVPVILGYDDRYFQDTYQYMPENGFTELFNEMLDHENIDIKLNVDSKDVLEFNDDSKKIYYNGSEFKGKIIYTGALDELLDYKYNPLPYRSLNLVFESYNLDDFQNNAVVNYPNEEAYTRITEFKHLTKQVHKATSILKEYPMEYIAIGENKNTPYYPIINEENNRVYSKYNDLAKQYKNLFLCGRLADYKYYNMDAAIENALEIVDLITKV